jgi:hypothetical protein
LEEHTASILIAEDVLTCRHKGEYNEWIEDKQVVRVDWIHLMRTRRSTGLGCCDHGSKPSAYVKVENLFIYFLK